MTRDEYVARLKAQLDRWNEDVARWEAQAKVAQADAKKRLEEQLALLRAQRENALYNLTLLQKASATAWTDLSRGADQAWEKMRAAVDKARTHFEKK